MQLFFKSASTTLWLLFSPSQVLSPCCAGRVPKTHATVAYMRALQEREPDWEERINQVAARPRIRMEHIFVPRRLFQVNEVWCVRSVSRRSALIQAVSGARLACLR